MRMYGLIAPASRGKLETFSAAYNNSDYTQNRVVSEIAIYSQLLVLF